MNLPASIITDSSVVVVVVVALVVVVVAGFLVVVVVGVGHQVNCVEAVTLGFHVVGGVELGFHDGHVVLSWLSNYNRKPMRTYCIRLNHVNNAFKLTQIQECQSHQRLLFVVQLVSQAPVVVGNYQVLA